VNKRIFSCFIVLLSFNALAGTLVQFRTTWGDLDVELYDQDKPVTVQNFLRYVKSGAYTTNMFIHRCIPGFVAQGGGFLVANRFDTNAVYPNGVYFGPDFGTITNEFNVGRRFSNTYGTIAMAKAGGNPDSASSQWFFNLADNSANLDFQNGGFTVFGRVVRGTNVLTAFNSVRKDCLLPYFAFNMNCVWTNTYFGETFSDLPVNYSGHFYPRYVDLIYVYDLSLLSVRVQQLENRTHQISWNSVSNAQNYVEFTTNLPPLWQSLLTTNGNGKTLQVIDPATNSVKRFYRVRVTY